MRLTKVIILSVLLAGAASTPGKTEADSAPSNNPQPVQNAVQTQAPAGDAPFIEPDADVVLKNEGTIRTPEEGAVLANVSIDWSKPTVQTSRKQFSLNVFGGFAHTVGSQPAYQENMRYMNPGLVRYHSMKGMMSDAATNPKGWIDYQTKTWNPEKIKTALDAIPLPEAEILITIGRWPPWMDADKNGQLDPDQYAAFAELCAELVRIVNVEQKRGIPYFEITNERDFVYWLRQMKQNEPLQVAELAKIYNQCAIAMKQVDPTIKTGGPSACRGDLVEPMRHFAILAKDNLDFLSYHTYASGVATESDESIFTKTKAFGKTVNSMRKMLDSVSPERRIEIHLNEYNICYASKIKEPRMSTNKGAVFDALVFIQFANTGLDASNAWSDCDNNFGKMDRNFVLRPAAHVFHFFNTKLIGQAVLSESDQPETIVPFAVQTDTGRNFVLVNRSPQANRVRVSFIGGTGFGAEVRSAQISDSGLSEAALSGAELEKEITLPPFSVSFYFCSAK